MPILLMGRPTRRRQAEKMFLEKNGALAASPRLLGRTECGWFCLRAQDSIP